MSEALGVQQPVLDDGLLQISSAEMFYGGRKKGRGKAKYETTSEQIVFDFESALFRGDLSGRIFGAINYGQDSTGAEIDNGTSGSVVLESFQQFDQATAARIPRESQGTQFGAGNSQYNSFGASYLQAANNYRLTDEHFSNKVGAKGKYRNNINAIRLLYELEERGASATKDEQDILAKYVGWGGIPQAFDPLNADWQKEFAELKEILTADDYDKAKESVLTSFYTPKKISRKFV